MAAGGTMKAILIILLMVLSACGTIPHPKPQPKIEGALITDKHQIDELADVATAFAYVPTSLDDMQGILEYNEGRLIPVIELSKYLWNEELGLFEYKHIPLRKEVVILLDEPLWRIRRACEAGKVVSCLEIDNKFARTQAVFKGFKSNNILHIEAYLELIKQKQQFNRVFMVDVAKYIGFDCYGTIKNCGGYSQLEYLQWITDSYPSKKIFLTVGAWKFTDTNIVIDQIHQYFNLYRDNTNLYSGIGVFTWGNYDGIIGAREIPELAKIVKEELAK